MWKKTFENFILIIAVISFISCEDEYNELGRDFINSISIPPVYELENITAYSEHYNSVQTNGLNNYLLGTYADPVFGLSEAKILTQVSLTNTNPDFGNDPILDSVVLTLPFYSREVEQNVFELDSVYGEGSFKLNVYESNQFLRDLDPGQNGEFESNQVYYSDQEDDFSANISNQALLTSEVIKPTDMTSGVVIYEQIDEDNIDTLSLSPRVRLKLPVSYFEDKILDPTNSEFLVSNNAFKNYLRGFLFEAEQQQPVKSMVAFNLNNADANITMYYRNVTETQDDDGNTVEETSYRNYTINFNGNKVNLFSGNFDVDLSNQDIIEGEENIYLKGGEGASGIIELFTGPDSNNDGVSDELEQLRQNNWLVNEANMNLYVNDDIASTSKNRIDRVLLVNLDDNTVLEDYRRDPTATENPGTSRVIHLGPLEEDDNGDLFYKIRLTSHINDLINNEADNVKLGLYVTSNVNQTNSLRVRNSLSDAEVIPASMVTTPRGIVIHGNKSPEVSKRLKLNIIFTETN